MFEILTGVFVLRNRCSLLGFLLYLIRTIRGGSVSIIYLWFVHMSLEVTSIVPLVAIFFPLCATVFLL